MISKQDVLLLLTELSENGVECDEQIASLYSNSYNVFTVLKFINENRSLDLVSFYDKLRKSYNKKHSQLYKNIVKCDENVETDPNLTLTTLTALLNQIMQFKTDNKGMFLKHSRAEEIIKVLEIYINTFNLQPAQKLLTLIKADLIVSEYLDGRRNIE